MNDTRARLRRLVETAVMIAAAVALSYVKLWHMPQGGSVTLGSMVPILLIALRYGSGWGITAGVLNGILQYLVDPYPITHPAQFLLDYPIAFGLLGLAGLASRAKWWVGAIMGPIALVGRMAAHVIAGAIFFAEYAPAGQSPWLYSIIYNGSYMLPEIVLSGVLLVALLPALERALPTGMRVQHN